MTGAALIHPKLWRLAADSVCRLVTVKPGMCGHNSLFVGQVGDWTWETVSDVCDTDAFNARDAAGAPTYLSFYFFHVKAGPRFHSGSLSFGDRVEVMSRVFGFGSESVLTVHRIRPAGDGWTGPPTRVLDPDEVYVRPRADSMYVQNFNRWISRSRAGSNEGLVTSAPTGFRHDHLFRLPEHYSPRRVFVRARTDLTFHDPTDVGWEPRVTGFEVEYPVDITRDINGVGLLYFASYFSIVDGALLRLWRHLGRDDRSFLNRLIIDQKLCYLGNADPDSVLRIELRSWCRRVDPSDEIFNAVVTDRRTGRGLAVCTTQMRTEVPGD